MIACAEQRCLTCGLRIDVFPSFYICAGHTFCSPGCFWSWACDDGELLIADCCFTINDLGMTPIRYLPGHGSWSPYQEHLQFVRQLMASEEREARAKEKQQRLSL